MQVRGGQVELEMYSWLCVSGQVGAHREPRDWDAHSPIEADSKKPHRQRAGVLVTCPSLVIEGGASLQGVSASRPIPRCASVQLAHVPARSHTGIAGPRRSDALPIRGSWPDRAATACKPAARRGRSSGAESARRCGRASTRRGRSRRAAAAGANGDV